MSPPTGDEPYAGPPPTGPYSAPPVVPGAAPRWGAVPPPPGGWPPPPWTPPLWAPPPWTPPPWTPPPWQPGPWAFSSGPPVPLAPPPGTPPHDVPRPFLQVMRSRDWAWWRPLLGLFLLGVVYTVAVVLVVLLAFAVHASPDLGMTDLSDPLVLLITNLSLIVAIPAVWLAWFAAHGMRIGWSASVVAHLRRRLFAPFVTRALLTLGVGIGLTVLVGWLADPGAVHGPSRDFGWLVLVVLLTTPLQSAAEEYFFRGYLSQSIAGWIRSPRAGAVVAAVLTAALFSAAHAPGDVLTFLDRFAFGLAASAVVSLTGGLEAAIVLHAVNNVLVFLLAGLLGQSVETGEAAGGTPILFVVVDVLTMAAYVWLVARARGRLQPETRTAAADLRTGGPAVARVAPPVSGTSGMVVSGVADVPRHPWGMG